MTPYEEKMLEIELTRNDLIREQTELMKQQNTFYSRLGATIGKLNTTAEFLALAIINKTVCRFTYPIEKYRDFDWNQFGAEIVRSDRSGPAVLVWRGDTYTRRSNQKNGNDIWFSRLIGTTEGGKHIYDVLVKFSDGYGKATSLPDELKDAIGIRS